MFTFESASSYPRLTTYNSRHPARSYDGSDMRTDERRRRSPETLGHVGMQVSTTAAVKNAGPSVAPAVVPMRYRDSVAGTQAQLRSRWVWSHHLCSGVSPGFYSRANHGVVWCEW